jgi:hypothetical protein
MKKLVLVCVLNFSFGVIPSLIRADDRERVFLCEGCGAPVRTEDRVKYKSKGDVDPLLCKKCLQKIKKGKKERTSSSVSPSSFSIGSDSVFDSPSSSASMSPVSPSSLALAVGRGSSVPATFVVDEKRAAQLAEFIVEQRLKKGMRGGENFLESYGEPATFDEALSLKIRMFERLYEASKMPEGETYTCTLHEVKKCAEVVDPQGNEHFLEVDDTLPFLWKRGGVFVVKRLRSIEVKDLVKDCSCSFPADTVSLAALKEKCQEYGFDKVEPLTCCQEADLAYQAMLARLPSPKL